MIFTVVKRLSKKLINNLINKYCKKDIIVYIDEYAIYILGNILKTWRNNKVTRAKSN